jgi:TP901 family phage tail tape measure protein
VSDLAGGRKEYELLFKLKAALGSNFNSSFQTAMNTTKQLQGTLTKINSLSGKIDGYKKQSNAVEKSRAKLAELTAEHERLQQEMNQTENPSESLRRKFERNARQIATTTTRIEEQERRLGELGEELRSAGVNTNNLEAANERLARSYQSIQRNQEELSRITAAQQRNVEQLSKTRGQLMGTVGVITAVGAAIYAGPVKGATEFERAMAKVGTIADKTAVPLGAMGKDVLRLSNEMGVAANAIAEDVYNAISAGQDTADAVKFVEEATKLAKGGFAETGQALDVLTTILNAYGMESEDATKVSDMLIQTQNKGKVTVAELSTVMGKIIPTAKANNVALEQLGAGYAIMTSKGIAAAESTTYMNSMLNELGKTGSKTDKALKKATGSSFKELMENGKSVAEVLEIVEGEAKKSGLSLSDMFGRAEAGKAALTIMSDGVVGFNDSVTEMINSTGETEEAFGKMMDTTEAKVDKAKNSIKNMSIILGQTFLPYAGQAAEKVSELVTKFAEFAQENPEVVANVAKVVAGLAAFKVATLGAKIGFLELRGGTLAVQKVFRLFRGRTAVAGVEAIGLSSRLRTAGAGLRNYFGGIRGALGGVGSAIGQIFSGGRIATMFSGIGNAVTGIFGGIGGKIVGAFGGVGGRITSIFGSVGSKIIAGPLGKIGMVVAKPFMSIGRLISPLMNLGGAILGPFSGIFGKIFPVVGVVMLIISAIQILRDNLDKVRGVVERVFGEAGLKVFDKVVATIGNIGNAIKNVFSDNGISGIKKFIDDTFGENPALKNFLNAFVDVFATIGSIVGQFITFVDTSVKPVIVEIFNFIVGTVLPMIAQKFAEWAPTIASIIQGLWTIIQGVATAVMNIVSVVMPMIQSIITGALHTIMQVIGGLLTTIKGIINFIVGVFTGDWEKAWTGVKDIFKGIFQSLGGIVKAPLNAVISIVNGVIGSINKVGFDIPDWVPVVGGKKFDLNIPKIPMFAKGSNYTPDTFIAGEKGAELITNAKGRKVFTAAQTGQIFNNINKASTQNNYNEVKEVVMFAPMLQAMLSSIRAAAPRGPMLPQLQLAYSTGTAAGVTAPTVKADSTQTTTKITIHNQPTIHVDGNAPNDLEEKLKKNNEELLNEVDERMRKKEEDERRNRYE